jgi:mannose-6-phosphate isomerase-like protein (cupin superfamily)
VQAFCKHPPSSSVFRLNADSEPDWPTAVAFRRNTVTSLRRRNTCTESTRLITGGRRFKSCPATAKGPGNGAFRFSRCSRQSTTSLLSMEIVRREQREPLITADGSSVRELAGIPSANATNQSLAEAIVPPASATIAHLHRRSEEIYLFTRGSGRMRLGDEERPVRAGDCVVIPPGVVHKLWSGEQEPLVLLCCCSPAYSHADTVLLEN